MENLIAIQVEAIKNIKIDKITVWDGGQSAGQEGKGGTAGFLSGLMKSIPPMNELFNMAGMNLPEFLGKDINDKDIQALKDVYEQKLLEAAEQSDNQNQK